MRSARLLALRLAAAGAAPLGAGFLAGDWLPLPAPPGLTERGAEQLRGEVAGGGDVSLRWADFRDLRPELRRLYDGRGWTLAWLDGGRPTGAALRLSELLDGAAARGLDPEDYGGDWAARLAAFGADATEVERVRLDVAFSVSALRFVADATVGRIRPTEESALLGRVQLARSAPPPDASALVARLAEARDPEEVLAGAEPDWPAYRLTAAALQAWRARLGTPWPPRPVPEVPRAPDEDGSPSPLPARLAAYGVVPESPEGRDPSCRAPLAEAVARFQAREGLPATGLLDAATVRELNVPPARRVAQLALALERWRWTGRQPPGRHVVVNVPEFALRAVGPGESLSMRVVVGRAFEWGTPLLSTTLSTVTFRPPWTVPLPIQLEELAPLEASSPGLLAAGGFDVVNEEGRPVPGHPGPGTLEALRSGAVRLRQRPGPANALGAVRFDLDGSRWIYLHGTPAPEAFAKTRRDLSHGCIRVEDPVALAAWVLGDDPAWSRAAIGRAMAGRGTLEVALRVPIPVRVGYFTATAWDGGEAAFHPDLYGLDAALGQALAEEATRRGAR
jgi:murein L,D-transpeptidase YcbB/YkuD